MQKGKEEEGKKKNKKEKKEKKEKPFIVASERQMKNS